jgi:hypothetical protein
LYVVFVVNGLECIEKFLHPPPKTVRATIKANRQLQCVTHSYFLAPCIPCAGDLITQGLGLGNVGNVRANITAAVAGTALVCGPLAGPGGADNVDPGTLVYCVYNHTVTQTDINGGNVTVVMESRGVQARSGSLPEFVVDPFEFVTLAQPEPELTLVNDLTSGNSFNEVGE